MKRATGFGRTARHALAITMLAVLTACGGGGGGGDGGLALIDLTTGNRESVAHAAAASVMSLGLSSSVPVLGGAGPAGILWHTTIGAGREHPKAIVSGNVPCDVSGYATVTLNDLNGDSTFNVVGETATVVFNQCQDDAYEVMNGTAVLTLTGVDSLTFDMTQLSQTAVNGRHAMTLDGSLNLVCVQLSSTSGRCTSTARQPLRAVIHTHLFDDTVTAQTGFVEEAILDEAAGQSSSTLRGTVSSAAAGGAFSVATDVAIGSLFTDPYPHEGRLRVTGERGTMLISPQSATQVRIELDTADDGTFESSEVVDWDWLL